MCLRSLRVGLLMVFAWASAAGAAPLHICADPDNLPFSNRAGQGFDNRIGEQVALTLHREAVFVWARNGRAFLREKFNKGACDALMGVPEKMGGVLATIPYYRSVYVFVTRKREHLEIASFDDPHLKGRKIGLQVLEDNLSPPSLALIRTGHAAQLVGFNSFGAHGPDIVRAVVDRQVGTAVVWGPVAGYFTSRDRLPLELTPVSPLVDVSGVPFAFSISMAVHKQDTQLLAELNAALAHLEPKIQKILANYGVPTLPTEEAP
jgi:mxaJ protein